MTKKHEYSFIKEEFEKKGYKLLDEEYVDSKHLMKCVCDEGHLNNVRWNDFQQGHECAKCVDKNIKYTYEEVVAIFDSKGFTLLSKEYHNVDTKLYFRCDKGHIRHVELKSILKDKGCNICRKNNMGGENNPNYRGGVSSTSFPLYATYAKKLEKYQPTYLIVKDGLDLLGVECMYCNQIFVPTVSEVTSRLAAINKGVGENNFYCSGNCKTACPTFGRRMYPKGFKPATSREVQPALRKMVLKRDNYQCQKCFKGLDDAELHCHHIDPIINNPIESADIDNCIIYCIDCHIQVHKLPGCTYSELRC